MESCKIVLIVLTGLIALEDANVTGELKFPDDGNPTNVTVVEGEDAQFDCRIGGLEQSAMRTYAILWQSKYPGNYYYVNDVSGTVQNHDKYNISTDFHTGSAQSILTVKNVLKSDRKNYLCLLYEDSTYVSKSKLAYLSVIEKPFFTQMPLSRTVIEGQSLTLNCSLQNLDRDHLKVSWFHNWAQLSQDRNIIDSIISDSLGDVEVWDSKEEDGVDTYHLTVSNIKRNSSGDFRCCVYLTDSNRFINKTQAATIKVLYPPGDEYPKCAPSNLKDYYSEGETLETACLAVGGNAPVYFIWIKNGNELNGTNDGDMFRVVDKWTLDKHDDGSIISCLMKGPAILNKRKCTIGKITVRSSTNFIENVEWHLPVFVAVSVVAILIIVVVIIVTVCVYFRRRRQKERADDRYNELKTKSESLTGDRDGTGHDATAQYEEVRNINERNYGEINSTPAAVVTNETTVNSATVRQVNDMDAVDKEYDELRERQSQATKQTAADDFEPDETRDQLGIDDIDEKRSRNVEGLVYAQLDLQQDGRRARKVDATPTEEEEGVTYAELGILK